MKALGIKNRCRIFEIPKTVDYIVAPPRMQTYVDISADIYGIYLKYIAKEDIHVYSIDEAFMDVTDYLALYRLSAKALGFRIMQDIYEQTGIRTMGDIASADENLLYHLFGVDAELLIDHAWGREPVTIADIKTYRPHTNSDRLLIPAVTALYEKIVNPEWFIHRVNITCNHVMPEAYHQYNFFVDAQELEKNREVQKAVIDIKNKFGKDAILKGMNLEEGATTRERNHQIGGHKSGR